MKCLLVSVSRQASLRWLPPTAALASVLWIALLLRLPELESGMALLGAAVFVSSLACVLALSHALRAARRQVVGIEASMARRLELHAVDEITGVLTRRAFVESAERLLQERKAGRNLAFLAIDLDYLKSVNDSFGHKAGDTILRRLAAVLSGLCEGALVGRIGGDEFAMLVPCEDARDAERLAGRLYAGLERPVETGGRSIPMSATVGAVLLPDQAHFLTQAMQFADLALYRAKNAGRGRLVLFDEAMLRELKRHRLIERELRAALLLDELDLHYQPIVNGDNEVFALEALMRWDSSTLGRIAPSEFIRVAESSTLIDQLGAWALERACLDARDFGDVRVCVNVSAAQLKRDDVLHAVKATLRRTGLPAGRLILELTESVAIEATPAMQARLSRLREMGIAIALDDFGTGFSGFDYLRRLPADKIKIDRSYIAKLGESEADNVLVSALATVARTMRMGVVAEGIETQDQMLLARAAGCALFQGYHVARPAPKAEVIRRWIHPPAKAVIERTG